MPTLRQGVPPRLHRALEILAEQPDGMHVQDLWARVVAGLPLEEHEAVPTKSGRQTKGENNWRWYTSDAVLAGLIWKQKGFWRITSLGRRAIAQFSDPDDLLEITRSALNYTNKHRAGYEYAAKILSTVVTAGRWVVLDDLAAVAELDPQRLAAWLCGIRPPGGFRVLSADGWPLREVRPDPAQVDRWVRLLAADGVPLTPSGAADGAARIGRGDISAMLTELERDDAERRQVRRAWLVGGSAVQGMDVVPKWRIEGFCSLAASRLGELVPSPSKDQLNLQVEERYGHLSYSQRTELAEQFWTFLHQVRIDDVVAAFSGGRLYLGTVTGEPYLVSSPDGRSNLRRPTDWSQVEVEYGDLPEELQAKRSSQHDIVNLTQLLDVLDDLLGLQSAESRQEAGADAEEIQEARSRTLSRRSVTLPDPAQHLADDLLVDLPWLREVRDLLDERRQLVFYGPPGTGKTYLAQALAEHLAGDPRAVKLVQFHPSYAYEDFFEGFRPVARSEGSGTVGFELRPGPFRKLVALAEDNPETPHFLIIDEINRANLAKVFGELYFVLEYRNRTVDLQYSGEFTLPSNVYLIGTMNTADRSIALVDAAMRRRFAFVELHPDEEPTRELLPRWLAREGLSHDSDDVPGLLRKLNSRIDDKDFRIGPSYLMRESVYAEGGLERTWRSAILPLLEEHHYGEGVDIEGRYGLPALRRALARDSGAPGVPLPGQGTHPADDGLR